MKTDSKTVAIRRTILKTAKTLDKIHREDLIAHTADVTQADSDRVVKVLENLKKRGEVYEVPRDQSPEVKVP